MKKTNQAWMHLSVVMGVVLLPAIAFADAGDEVPPNFSGLQWIWALFSLVIVLGIAYWVTKKMAGKLGYAQAKHLKVAESLFLGPNRHLYLLLFHGKILLVSSTEGGIQLIKELDDPQLYEELQKNAPAEQPVLGGKLPEMLHSFQKVLTAAIQPPESSEDDSSVRAARQKLLDGLERIKRWNTKGKGRSR